MSDEEVLPYAKALLLLFWASVIRATVLGAVHDSPIRLRPRGQSYVAGLVPEGWNFFTRSAREPVMRAFQWKQGEWKDLGGRNSSHWFGITKEARIVSMDLQYLTGEISAEAWRACEVTTAACLLRDELLPAVRVQNSSNLRRVCGKILLDHRPLVPWAWSRPTAVLNMPGQYAILDVTCVARQEMP